MRAMTVFEQELILAIRLDCQDNAKSRRAYFAQAVVAQTMEQR